MAKLSRQKLLQRLHELVWADDDIMDQDNLFEMQTIIDSAIIEEHRAGRMQIEQLTNGYIKKMQIIKETE